MPKFLKFASITKKVTLALIGLFLMVFLLVHLGINLCMLRNDGGEWFRIAAHFMGTNYFVKVFEVVLFGAILLHITLALIIQIQNWRARPIGYKSRSKSKTAPASRLMIWSGILIATFLVVHFMNFYFVKVGWVEGRYLVEMEDVSESLNNKQQAFSVAYSGAKTAEERIKVEEEITVFQEQLQLFQNNEKIGAAVEKNAKYIDDLTKEETEIINQALQVKGEPDFYMQARQLFKNTWLALAYVIFLIALGFHLMHAFQSAFQTLGLAHSKYTPAIKIVGTLFAIGVSAGFAIVPLFFYFIKM